ncbi:MAG TPA: phospholipase D-like domain-containing protein [Thermoanaerobaculia bacterium]|nr:phospholipase D-like domain-containing protein [Thermoanaerobaculia bacterium]
MKRTDFPARRRLAAAAFLLALIPLAGCSYLFGDKRTSYDYKPAYGVDSAEFRRSLDVLGTEMVPHNKATLLQNGDQFFPAMLQAIRDARRSVNMEMFIFDDGEIAGEFARALSEKAREGVEVRLLIDDYGSHLGALEDQMKAAGVKVREYKPLRIYTIYKIGNRTHRKILTVDGKIGFTGGVGIDDRWRGDARNPKEWRETMVQVEGPVVAQLQSIFMEDWVHTTGEVLHGERQFPPLPAAGEVLAQAIRSSRTDPSSMAKLLYYMGIQAARQRIWIENAYFVPDGQIRRGLVAAVARGVDVRVLVPGRHIDVPIVRQASRFHYGELLDGGVKIYEYRPTMLHNKVMVVDGIWSTIGSINFVNRSMKKQAEANVAIYDRAFAELVEKTIAADLEKSEQFTRARWEKRGLLARLSETVFWLFSENY